MSSFRALAIAATGMNARQARLQAAMQLSGKAWLGACGRLRQAGSACFEVSRMAI